METPSCCRSGPGPCVPDRLTHKTNHHGPYSGIFQASGSFCSSRSAGWARRGSRLCGAARATPSTSCLLVSGRGASALCTSLTRAGPTESSCKQSSDLRVLTRCPAHSGAQGVGHGRTLLSVERGVAAGPQGQGPVCLGFGTFLSLPCGDGSVSQVVAAIPGCPGAALPLWL